MNASRRVCCNAANAFRPRSALRNVFYNTTPRRCASQAKAKHRKRSKTSVLYKDVINEERRTGHGLGAVILKEKEASYPGEKHAATQQKVVATTALEEDLGKVLEEDQDIAGVGQLDIETAVAHLDDLYIDNAADEEDVASAKEAVPETQHPEPAEGSHGHETTQATNVAQPPPEYQSPKLAAIAVKKLANEEKDGLEYEGQYVRPAAGGWQFSMRLPWLAGLDCNNREMSATKRMGQEIDAFAKWIRLTAAENTAREAIIDQTMKVVRQNAKGFSIEPFGSSRSGLALASSDIDLRIFQDVKTKEDSASWLSAGLISLPPRGPIRRANLLILHKLLHIFQKHPDYVLCTLRNARYPLLNMHHKPSGIDVQIVCANDTSEQRDYIRALLLERPELFKLYAILKTALDIRGLTDVYRGGLGSYAIFIMIVAALNKQHYDDIFNARRASERVLIGDTQADAKLANQLMQVMRFWAFFNSYDSAVIADPVAIVQKLDPVTGMGVNSVTDGRSSNAEKHAMKQQKFSQLRLLDLAKPYLLCLIDPRDSTNDLGRQAYGWKHIQATMLQLSKGLLTKSYHDYRNNICSFLGPLVGTAPKEYRLRRIQMRDFARMLKPEDVFKDVLVGADGKGKIKLEKSGQPVPWVKRGSKSKDAQDQHESINLRQARKGIAARSIFFESKEAALAAEETTATPWELAKFTAVTGVPHKKAELRASKALELKLRNAAKLEMGLGMADAQDTDAASHASGVLHEQEEDGQDTAACVTLPKPVEQESATMEEHGKAVATAS